MARISIEDCLDRINNRFALVHLVCERSKQLLKGSIPLIQCDNKDVVTSLREVAADKIKLAKVLDET
ncbi:MAG: DNA-directed RNA polymerase subunit omega, partial [Deltaproteobacteria bacterium]|nr:DNA-directed RNA polymerase subunit omega [Deltaproteobacteria bacterium]